MNSHESGRRPIPSNLSDAHASVPAPARLQELEAEYEITGELGRGGTAVVYHARERELGREVAIKVVHQTHVDDGEAVARLAREARLVAQLRHPNIVTLFGTRQLSDGSVALMMQYVPGRTLKAAIREDGPLPIRVVETVLREMALALHHAHQRQGLVHRDLKPENIYLDTEGGRSLLSDFGIARATEVESTLTLVGTALGTPAYMSPEQIDGLPLDGRSDLYALGLVAYEMLTGCQPWAGHNLYTIIYKQKHEELPSIAESRSDVPPHMLRAINRLLRKTADERWPDALRFVSALSPASVSGAIAPPVMTHRPRTGSAPVVPPMDDSLTIVYRPQDEERGSSNVDPSTPEASQPAAGADIVNEDVVGEDADAAAT
ncbi:MAG TPA: serine/threonine-protein kinase, partial [Longimicrobiales bacterium]|nr:serine/threonine-protein kinase [Longimicrobiales bacterium]